MMNEPKSPAAPPFLRSFVALGLDTASIEFLERSLERQIRHYPGFRTVPIANWHITVHFLGNQPLGTLEALSEAIDSLASRLPHPGPFPLVRLGLFPHPTQGNIIAAEGLATTAMYEWHQALAQSLVSLDVAVENRPWRPHITLARRRAYRTRQIAPAADLALDWTVRLERVSLMLSKPTTQNNRYQALKTWNP